MLYLFNDEIVILAERFSGTKVEGVQDGQWPGNATHWQDADATHEPKRADSFPLWASEARNVIPDWSGS